MLDRKKSRQFIFVLIVSIFVFSSCGTSPEMQILGKWYDLDACSNLEFFDNGTVLISQDGTTIGDYQFLDERRVRLDWVQDGVKEPTLLLMEQTQTGTVLLLDIASQRQTFYAADASSARQNADTYLNCGLVHHTAGAYDLAIVDYGEAIQIDSKYALPYTYRADAYYQKGDYELAASDYGEAIRIEPENDAFYTERGDIYYQMGTFEEAITDYSEAIGIDPNSMTALHKRGDIYYEQGDYEASIEDYTKAIQLDPQYANTFYKRADAYYRHGAHDLAIIDYTEAIRISPDHAMAYLFRGWAYDERGKPDQAVKDYKEALALGLSDQNQSWAEERLSALE